MNKEERRALLSSVPWIKRLTETVPCDGVRWSRVPLKAIYSIGGKPPTGLDEYRCKNQAPWHFRALKRSLAKTGNYCYNHLFSLGLAHDMWEQQRFEHWYYSKKKKET